MSGATGSVPGDAASGEQRKADHLRIALHEDVGHRGVTTGLEGYRLRARALPGRALSDVALHTVFLDWPLSAPLLLSCMTGGTTGAGPVNRALAHAAQVHGVAVGLGSGRVLLEGGDPASFAVRDVAPDVLLLANLGAVQLGDVGVEGCQRLVAATDADGLVLHLNAVQEAVQPGGDTGFGPILGQIEALIPALEVPVVVKEVGFGLAPEDVEALYGAGVAGIDVAGAGGTNWATVEGFRDDRAGRVAEAFAGWGWSTVESLTHAVEWSGSGCDVVASGGIRDGVDAAICLALGADVVGFGRRILAAAADGPEAAVEEVGVLIEQLRIAVWGTGVAATTELGPDNLIGPAAPADRPGGGAPAGAK